MSGLLYNNPIFMIKNGHSWTSRVAVILVHPQTGENIGMAARAMANTGFRHLRIVGMEILPPEAGKTAVHAGDILRETRFFPTLEAAGEDLHILLAGTSKKRKKYVVMSLDEALEVIEGSSDEARIGLVFGNERTGLTSDELLHTNYRFTIPQSGDQPSYNLAAAVLLTLYSLFIRTPSPKEAPVSPLLNRAEQEACIRLILQKIDERGFINPRNRDHIGQIVFDLFGRVVLTDRDRRLLLALFSKGLE